MAKPSGTIAGTATTIVLPTIRYGAGAERLPQPNRDVQSKAPQNGRTGDRIAPSRGIHASATLP
jgi:hypothetical protein